MPDWEKALGKYISGRTLKDVADDFGVSARTLRRHFDSLPHATREICVPAGPAPLAMDATFFSRHDGILVGRANRKNLLWKEIENEKAEDYEWLAATLLSAGMDISAFVIDGRRGVLQRLLMRFPGIPVQLCQFHQIAIVKRYLTSRPKLQAGKELRNLTLSLTETNRAFFAATLEAWHERWKNFLGEKIFDPVKNKQHYVHRRLRSAHRSLRTNLPWLFTFQDYPELNIPNTTNSCDGWFAHFKGRLGKHRGTRRARRKKIADYLLEKS